MGHVFYAFGTLVLLSVVMSLVRFKKQSKVREWFVKYKTITGKEPTISDFRSKKDHTLYTNQNALLMIEFLWILIGFITPNWYLFLSVIVLGLFLNIVFRKIKFTMIGRLVSVKFIIYRALLYTFLIVNHFYLHIDIWDLLTKAS